LAGKLEQELSDYLEQRSQKVFHLGAWKRKQNNLPRAETGGGDRLGRCVARIKRGRLDGFAYFHSHIFEMVAPLASTSYSKAPQALLRRASFFEVVLKNNMPL